MNKGWTIALGMLVTLPALYAGESLNPDEFYDGKGIGPVDTVVLADTIDEALARKGEEIFKLKCSACHAMDKRVVGPPLAGVTKRRRPEWIMNMTLNPMEMVQKDPMARTLLGMYYTPMTPQNLTEEDARAVLEFFRKHDQSLKDSSGDASTQKSGK